jgi:hypothetical protein
MIGYASQMNVHQRIEHMQTLLHSNYKAALRNLAEMKARQKAEFVGPVLELFLNAHFLTIITSPLRTPTPNPDCTRLVLLGIRNHC